MRGIGDTIINNDNTIMNIANQNIIISGPVPVPNEHFPRSSIGLGLMIPLRLVGVPTMMLLAICLLLGLAAAAPLPRVWCGGTQVAAPPT